MFLGHFGLAFATKKVAPRLSLGTMVLAAQWVDCIWPILLLLGWEKVRIAPGITAATPPDFVSYPYTHSLAFVCIWAALFAGTHFVVRRDRQSACWLAVLVLSHWVLDFISHRPDMPLWPGSELFGLGLWHSLSASMVVETFLLIEGAWLYARSTRARDRIGTWAWWALVVTLLVLYLGSVIGPPPPNERVLAIMSLSGWLLVAWAYWIDAHRRSLENTGAVPVTLPVNSGTTI